MELPSTEGSHVREGLCREWAVGMGSGTGAALGHAEFHVLAGVQVEALCGQLGP